MDITETMEGATHVLPTVRTVNRTPTVQCVQRGTMARFVRKHATKRVTKHATKSSASVYMVVVMALTAQRKTAHVDLVQTIAVYVHRRQSAIRKDYNSVQNVLIVTKVFLTRLVCPASSSSPSLSH